jgi:serine/threonine-protein kinase
VLTALEKLPADRFASAAEFASALANPKFATAATAALTQTGSAPDFRGNRPALVMGGVALAAIAVALWGWRRPGPPQEVSRYRLALPVEEALAPISNLRLAISPDGRRLAYLGQAPQGETQLWLRTHDQLQATALAGTVGAINPAFSPDGAKLAFVSTGSGRPRSVNVIALTGGPATVLTDSLVDQGGLSWGYDGYVYLDGHLAGDGLARVRETGGSPEPVTMPDTARGEAWHFQPEALPNGRGVLFTVARGGATGQFEIAVADLKTGQHRILTPGVAPRYAASGHLLFVSTDGALMAAPFDQDGLRLTGEPVTLAERLSGRGFGRADLAVSRTGTLAYTAGDALLGNDLELVWVTRDGKASPVDSTWVGRFGQPGISPDGSRLAIAITQGGRSDVWVKQLDRGPASKLTFEGTRNRRPTWSPDGRQVVFTSTAGGARPAVFVGPADGSALPKLLLGGPNSITSAQYSKDGRWILYMTSEADLYAVATSGDTSRRVLVQTPFFEMTPALSPDGHWLAYASDESGRFEIYVRPFPETQGAKRQVSASGGLFPVWRRDGRELFYRTSRDEMVVVEVGPGATFMSGVEKPLFSTTSYFFVSTEGYDLHPDGQRFMMLRTTGASGRSDELIVVEHFFEELKAKVKR